MMSSSNLPDNATLAPSATDSGAARAGRRRWAIIAGVFVVATAAVTLASGALRSPQTPQHATPAPVSSNIASIARDAGDSPAATVRFANPFDPSEVFEFPAGTSEADARDMVGDILMQRARERGVPALSRSHKHPTARRLQ